MRNPSSLRVNSTSPILTLLPHPIIISVFPVAAYAGSAIDLSGLNFIAFPVI
jgi:hypothetical protein